MKYDLTTALKNLRVGNESHDVAIDYEPGFEPDSISANELEEHDKTQHTLGEFAEIDNAMDNSGAIQELTIATETLLAQNHKLSRIEEVALRLTFIQLKSYKKINDHGFLGSESFGGSDFTILALEDLKEKFNSIKGKTVEFIKKIWEKIAEFFKGILTRAGRLRKKAESILKTVNAMQETNGGEEFEVGRNCDKITNKETIKYGDLTTSIGIIKRCVDNEIIGVADAIVNSNSEELLENLSTAVIALSKRISANIDSASEAGKALSFNDDFKDKEGKDTRVAFVFVTDSIRYGNRTHQGIDIPVIDDANRVLENIKATSLSKKESIAVVEQVIELLKTNADKDYRAATKVLKNVNRLKDIEGGEDIIAICNMLSHFCIKKETIRLMIADQTLGFVMASAKLSNDNKASSDSSEKRAKEDAAAENLRTNMKAKDAHGTKVSLLNLILDMAVRTSSIKNYANLASKNVPDAFVEYEVTEVAEAIQKDKNKWTTRYFHEQNISLESNFCIERINHLLQVRDYLTEQGAEEFTAL